MIESITHVVHHVLKFMNPIPSAHSLKFDIKFLCLSSVNNVTDNYKPKLKLVGSRPYRMTTLRVIWKMNKYGNGEGSYATRQVATHRSEGETEQHNTQGRQEERCYLSTCYVLSVKVLPLVKWKALFITAILQEIK